MKIELHDHLGSPAKFEGTRVVIRDTFGNPVAIFIQVAPNNIFFRYKGAPGFEQALANLGINDTSVVEVRKVGALPQIEV